MKRIIVNGTEQEAYSRWGRKYLAYLQRPGVVKKIKKATHRRERREATGWIEEQLDD